MISGSKSGHLEDQEASRITLRCMLDRELCVNERWIKVKCVMVAETDIIKDFNKLQNLSFFHYL